MLPFFSVRETYQDLKRYSQIATVFFRYGFGNLLDRLRARYYVTWPRSAIKGQKTLEQLSTPERLRMAFEELGPTFIKLGQILSSRPDLLSPDYVAELGKLQDTAPPFPFDQARAVLEEQTGRAVADLFSSIEEAPVAAASLAQVHRAWIPSGEAVAVKIQRPGIEGIIETDIRILYDLARLAERHIAESRYFEPERVVDQFARTIRRELDFEREGRMIERFGGLFADDPGVHIPGIHWEVTGPKVLTTEYISGIKISELEQLEEAGLDRRVIAVRGADLILKEIFDYRLFHADPHPGNLFVLSGNVIAPVDFGMTGTLSEELAEQMASIFVALIHRDSEELIDILRRTGWFAGPDDDFRGLREEIDDLIDRYYGIPLGRVHIRGLFEQLMGIIRRYGLHLPGDLILMAKALLISEGVGRLLYPGFNIIEHARPYARRLMLRRLDPRRGLLGVSRVVQDSTSLLGIAPSAMRAILTKMAKGQFALEFAHKGLENLVAELDRSSNRLSSAIVIASLIIGSSLIFMTGVGPTLLGYPLIGLIGFLLASLLGVWLLIGIVRSGRL